MRDFNYKTVLVTGAAGFIGCNFVRIMLKKYPRVKIISFDKLTYAGSLENLKDIEGVVNHIFIKGDICDDNLVREVLRKYSIDTIVHFAAESHVDNSISGPAVFIKTNINGTFTLLEEARSYWLEEKKLKKNECLFHHISTDEVFGSLQPHDSPFNEKFPYKPNSPYSASKAASDHLVRSYDKTYGLPVTISNCSNNYGPFQNHEKFIPTVIRSCLERKRIPIYGKGDNIREWLHVEDHCLAIDLILTKAKPGSVYNIGSSIEYSNLDIALHICKEFDRIYPRYLPHEQLIEFVADRKGHDFRYAIDSSKITKELGWKPINNFNVSITNLVENTLL